MADNISRQDMEAILRSWNQDLNAQGAAHNFYDARGFNPELQAEFNRLQAIAADRELAFQLSQNAGEEIVEEEVAEKEIDEEDNEELDDNGSGNRHDNTDNVTEDGDSVYAHSV